MGPILASLKYSKLLHTAGIPHSGATEEQLRYELDKSALFEIFGFDSDILPRSKLIIDKNSIAVEDFTSMFPEGYVVKFIGDYTRKFKGSEVGRVRIGKETLTDDEDALSFIHASLDVSGKALIQERLSGSEFSANYAVDGEGHIFRMGENICFKRRSDGNTGPMCDGTGSVTIGNTLPFLTHDDITFIEDSIVKPFHAHVTEATGVPLCTILNLDLMKTESGEIKLFEVNCREAGGHSMANILSGLRSSLFEVLCHMQQGSLNTLTPLFAGTSSLVVSAFPSYFPEGVESEEDMQIVEVNYAMPSDVKLYTGWVDVIDEHESTRTLKLRNSPNLLFEHSASSIERARRRLYPIIDATVQGRLDYRTDIGLQFCASP